MKYLQRALSVLVFAVLVFAALSPALEVQAEVTLPPGTVVSLQGTPHLWFADEEGILHWGGDTRALSGRLIDWNKRVEVSLEELQVLDIGDPWLSTGLLKDGDPIYLVKWETEWTEPQLLHIQTLKDVELFGIDSSNYGDFVLDPPTWEGTYGLSADSLVRLALEPATTPSSPAQGTDPTAPDSREAVLLRLVNKIEDDDDDDDLDDDTETNTATATATATGDQTATATATATDDGTSVTHTETDDTPESQNVATITATDTATATGTGDQTATATATATATGTGDLTATATATATDDGTSATQTATDDTPPGQNVSTTTATDTATATATGDQTATATATATDDGTSVTVTDTDPTDDTPDDTPIESGSEDVDSDDDSD